MIYLPFFGLTDRSITLDMQNNVGSNMFLCKFPHEIGWIQGLSSSIEKYEDNSNVLHPVQIHCCSSTEENIAKDKWQLKCTVLMESQKSLNKKIIISKMIIIFYWLVDFLSNFWLIMDWVYNFTVSTLCIDGTCTVCSDSALLMVRLAKAIEKHLHSSYIDSHFFYSKLRLPEMLRQWCKSYRKFVICNRGTITYIIHKCL